MRAGLRQRVDRLEQTIWQELDRDYHAWLDDLSDDQHKAYVDEVRARVSEEGLLPITVSEFWSLPLDEQREELWERLIQESSQERTEAIVNIMMAIRREMATETR